MDPRVDDRTVEDYAVPAGASPVIPASEQIWASRAVIERATGMLMERYGLDADRVNETLLQASSRAKVPMVRLAEETLAGGRGDEPPSIRQVLAGESTPPALRKAVAFIESQAGNPIRLGDIVIAAGVGTRALQYDFVRHYRTTPMRYLRAVRLQRAHRDLRTADPQRGDTVASIAARWGYSSPGRFAERYRAAYGRAPHRTLSEVPSDSRGTSDGRGISPR